MKLILKLIAAPFALALTIAAAFFSFILAVSDVFFGVASTLIFLISVALFITGQPMGGIAFLVIAFLVSPLGIPAFAGWLVSGLDGTGGALRSFLIS